jgi:hypothetical protein
MTTLKNSGSDTDHLPENDLNLRVRYPKFVSGSRSHPSPHFLLFSRPFSLQLHTPTQIPVRFCQVIDPFLEQCSPTNKASRKRILRLPILMF